MTDSLVAFYDELFFHSLHTRDKKKTPCCYFGQDFFGHCLFLFAFPSISMLLFLRVTTPALAKSTEKQSDTSPVQMCNYNRISLMGGVEEKKKRERKKEGGKKNLSKKSPRDHSSIYLTKLQLKTVSACII